jgi:hypothetical protein
MFRWKKSQQLREQAENYASHNDYNEIFLDDEAGLSLLVLLLTRYRWKADQCLVVGLNTEPQYNTVFRDWAHCWRKMATIKSAIQAVPPSPHSKNGHFNHAGETTGDHDGAVSFL